ncbi:AAA domain-containing protein [Pyxidicoccus fallax]|uniref:AAA domain-containing protein n=1 Tax=Pyxidicoccus fallax TaxID=394095 RepID=A0A848LU11_9BACT|nr:AAA domain-containing protein [Pyxidicoccus fallax]NPC83654.1 AAA domain-containing protein [Pyxidicoccus fallax]
MQPSPPPYLQAARAFRHFFGELRETYLERETLFTQLELALLGREHVLVVGPPGTAKSAIASAVLGRIVDERTGLPSLFSKQLAESTVQTDLIGPVDFKVLTETGRTEYLTDEGMLGSEHAFLDEVFDGRDMLLRSILNVLYERELKHGRRVTTGRTECVIMTSNRYLSEVLARSPELLLAFADRLSFICFVPKSFARLESRAAMLQRFAHGARPDLRAQLSLQQVDLLQDAVTRVKVPSHVLEGVELLADALERALAAQVSKLPDYVPTKYFSQRSAVKALWALKAAVVRDQIYRRADRPLEATVEDLDALRWFFLLGGPPAAETEALLKSVVDPRERAQLEIVRLEQRAFDEALAKVRQELGGGVEREAAALNAHEEVAAAESLSRNWQPTLVSTTVRALLTKLVPGPRHAQNRAPLLVAARALVAALEQRLARGMAGQGEGRGGLPLLASFRDALALCRAIPELRNHYAPLCEATARFLEGALEMIALSAESVDFEEGLKLEGLVGLADNLEEELSQTTDLAGQLSEGAPAALEHLRVAEVEVRKRVVSALRRRAALAFQSSTARTRREPLEALSADSRRLTQLEHSLAALDPSQQGLKQELLLPLGIAYAREVLSSTPFERIEQYGRAVQSVAENLRREGLSVEAVMAECRDIMELRLREHAKVLSREVASPPPLATSVLNGDAYVFYRGEFSARAPDGELAALLGLDGQLTFTRNGLAPGFLSESVRAAVAQAELSFVHSRIKYLRSWLTQLLTSLPAPDSLKERAEAERTVDRLVRSRFPLLALKEGELVRLRGVLSLLGSMPGDLGESARRLEAQLRGIDEDFGRFSRQVLERRSAS